MKVLAISGSLRRDSYNRKLLRAAAELLPADIDLEPYGGLKSVPPYDEDDDADPPPPAVARLREAIASADALLFGTPEYNSSIPGHLKNAVDWASRPEDRCVLLNKPAAVVGASTGAFGAVWSQAELRKVLRATGARVVDGEVPLAHAHQRFDEQGRLTDDDLRQALREVVETLVGEARLRAATVAASSTAGTTQAREILGTSPAPARRTEFMASSGGVGSHPAQGEEEPRDEVCITGQRPKKVG